MPGTAPGGDNGIVTPQTAIAPVIVKDTTAQLQLITDPPGATVLLDGALQVEKTPCTLTVEVGVAYAKTVEISLTHDGYHNELREVSLPRGKLTPVQVTLNKMEEPPQKTTPVIPIATKTNAKDGAEMVWVPSGEFTMGSIDFDDEQPVHQVNLDGFWMYKEVVTVAQYQQFCTATGREMPPAPGWGWQDDHPIVNVSWDDANAYAQWAGAALPTEAEWEKAACGTDGRKYPWGNDWDTAKCANHAGLNNPGKPAPVGSYPAGASPYGCLDMVGNVWQWCADWYDDKYYRNSPAHNPTGAETGKWRVLRGGFWGSSATAYLRTAFRSSSEPAKQYSFIGFRCVARSPAP